MCSGCSEHHARVRGDSNANHGCADLRGTGPQGLHHHEPSPADERAEPGAHGRAAGGVRCRRCRPRRVRGHPERCGRPGVLRGRGPEGDGRGDGIRNRRRLRAAAPADHRPAAGGPGRAHAGIRRRQQLHQARHRRHRRVLHGGRYGDRAVLRHPPGHPAVELRHARAEAEPAVRAGVRPPFPDDPARRGDADRAGRRPDRCRARLPDRPDSGRLRGPGRTRGRRGPDGRQDLGELAAGRAVPQAHRQGGPRHDGGSPVEVRRNVRVHPRPDRGCARRSQGLRGEAQARMEDAVRSTTVAFKIGPIFHLIHMSDDFWPLNDWYAEVFGAVEFTKHTRSSRTGSAFPTWSVELRDASLITIADVTIEPMSPSMFIDGWDKMPVGRFYTKFGRHWVSFAWCVDDARALFRELKDRNIRFFFNGGGSDSAREPSPDEALFTHPKDSCGALELMQGPRAAVADPRFEPGYDPGQWERDHPLGLRRLAYITITVSDLDKGKRVYVDALGGKLLLEDSSPLTMTKNAYVAVGDHSMVELAQPLEEGSLAGRELARNGYIMHAAAFGVADLDRAERHLTAKGVRILDRDAVTLLADPDPTFGAPFRFPTAVIPGDPRDAH